ncbi:MAG: hypothetical protein HY681_01650 [Chloroflexi bacterium]|nr:hypothetical protein [Chloroflexota bacterium]
MGEYLDEAQQVIRNPDSVLGTRSGAVLLYRFGVGRRRFSNLYLQVVVYYRMEGEEETGRVATFFFTDVMDDDAIVLEHRAQVIMGQRIMLVEELTDGNS